MTLSRELDPVILQAMREEAEASMDDTTLLYLRGLERATAELPPVIDGAHRNSLLCGDSISTTWTAWNPDTGERLLLRCLHPQWRHDPVLKRRLQRDLTKPRSPGLLCGTPVLSGDWPHIRIQLAGPRLSELLPLDRDDDGDPILFVRVLTGGLIGLEALHGVGLAHGPEVGSHLFFQDGMVRLAWLGRFGEPTSTDSDVRALALVSSRLCRQGMTPIRQLTEAWSADPPNTATDASRLVSRAMASTLLDARHRYWIIHRHQHRRQRIGRLAVTVKHLQEALGPPPGRVCLRANGDGQLVIAHSDGRSLRGQACTDPHTTELRSVYEARASLNPASARFLLRAWAMRERGDEERRRAVQSELKATDEQAERMMTWLSGMARLRAATLLLRAESKIREVASDRALERST